MVKFDINKVIKSESFVIESNDVTHMTSEDGRIKIEYNVDFSELAHVNTRLHQFLRRAFAVTGMNVFEDGHPVSRFYRFIYVYPGKYHTNTNNSVDITFDGKKLIFNFTYYQSKYDKEHVDKKY